MVQQQGNDESSIPFRNRDVQYMTPASYLPSTLTLASKTYLCENRPIIMGLFCATENDRRHPALVPHVLTGSESDQLRCRLDASLRSAVIAAGRFRRAAW